MKFKLTTTKKFYLDKDLPEYEKLGFTFGKTHFSGSMSKISDDNATIEFNTLEELMEFVEKWKELVISKEKIEIYNGYRE